MMKKYIYMMMAGLLTASAFAGCDDTQDLPDVSVKVTLGDCYRSGDVLYVVQGEDLEVEGVRLINNGNDRAVIGSVAYYWDQFRVYTSAEPPYDFEFDTAYAPQGVHRLTLTASVFATDYSPCEAYLTYDVVIVDSVEDVPLDAIPGSEIEADIRFTDN